MKSLYLVLFPCLTFAHLARCAAAILALAAADILRFPVCFPAEDVAGFRVLIFAQRALCAAAILARAAALNRPLPLPPVLPT